MWTPGRREPRGRVRVVDQFVAHRSRRMWWFCFFGSWLSCATRGYVSAPPPCRCMHLCSFRLGPVGVGSARAGPHVRAVVAAIIIVPAEWRQSACAPACAEGVSAGRTAAERDACTRTEKSPFFGQLGAGDHGSSTRRRGRERESEGASERERSAAQFIAPVGATPARRCPPTRSAAPRVGLIPRDRYAPRQLSAARARRALRTRRGDGARGGGERRGGTRESRRDSDGVRRTTSRSRWKKKR